MFLICLPSVCMYLNFHMFCHANKLHVGFYVSNLSCVYMYLSVCSWVSFMSRFKLFCNIYNILCCTLLTVRCIISPRNSFHYSAWEVCGVCSRLYSYLSDYIISLKSRVLNVVCYWELSMVVVVMLYETCYMYWCPVISDH